MTPREQWEATQKANGLGITWEEHLAQREQDHRRMIPLHIADQAVAACDAEIAKLKDENARLRSFCTRTIIPNIDLETENARLKAEVERLTKQVERLIVSLQKSHDEHGEALYKLKYKNERQTPRKKRSS
jgi:hypothetical protein